MTTTAEYRTEAMKAEQELRWADAAVLWGKAMNAYPEAIRRAGGQLYQRDMKNMLDRARSCTLAAHRARVDRRLYKELSNAAQRDEACRITEAVWSNAGLGDTGDYFIKQKEILSAKAEIERTILDLIIQRDNK